jgi:hypothetical protein
MGFDDLPPVLTPKHLKEFFGIGRIQSYALMNSGKFHVVRCGRRMFVLKEIFLEWLKGRKHQQD